MSNTTTVAAAIAELTAYAKKHGNNAQLPDTWETVKTALKDIKPKKFMSLETHANKLRKELNEAGFCINVTVDHGTSEIVLTGAADVQDPLVLRLQQDKTKTNNVKALRVSSGTPWCLTDSVASNVIESVTNYYFNDIASVFREAAPSLGEIMSNEIDEDDIEAARDALRTLYTSGFMTEATIRVNYNERLRSNHDMWQKAAAKDAKALERILAAPKPKKSKAAKIGKDK